jgi:hypothetical protein
MTLSQWQSLGYDLHSMLADPENQIFIDHLNENFHLLQNSQAVDAGTNLVLPTVLEDLDGVSRPQGTGFDIGCYEFTGTSEVFEENISQSFQLFQNYPNPFNPTTKIKFRIPEFGFTILKVYDILGNEVTTLVNEYKNPGSYEVEINTSTIKPQPSSGIYFYQLKSGSFISTKSMILIK